MWWLLAILLLASRKNASSPVSGAAQSSSAPGGPVLMVPTATIGDTLEGIPPAPQEQQPAASTIDATQQANPDNTPRDFLLNTTIRRTGTQPISLDQL